MTRPARSRSAGDGLRRIADSLGFALLWCWILVSVLVVPTIVGFWWIGVLLFVLGLIVCWQAAEASRDPVYTIGTKRDVRTGQVDTAGVDCDECGRSAHGGEFRRYERRRVLFGTTIAVLESGENVYCEQCVVEPRERIEPTRDRSDPGADTSDERDGDFPELESERV
ncbi:hypothetical protein EA462_00475 [Natrarchaeobius halalkaliphilus]|uniref:DUF8108 domain-containing protein n=1 Tax=Natrarchaeobius halalkaliphilus TaxID=1679091 RepID=A0A3N6N3N2_9EURY|nr:hypothetical protein [Natrarchaeobius halalkaliphilus]RQG92742.1 hypothetical protein EA462_00475 [Natrarchaeobius halalkaliphilus]